MYGLIYEATYGRVFAAGYDRVLAASERAGMSDRRRRLLAGARGATLEVGAGTGLNLPHYSTAADDLVLAEPNGRMARRLRQSVIAAGRPARVVEAPGALAAAGGSAFDTVVATFLLCSVDDPAAVLQEIARVLKPGGQYLFIEHVRSPDARLARLQDRWRPVWAFLAGGCQCNRDAQAHIAEVFSIDALEQGTLPEMPKIVQPLIEGRASLA